MSIRLACEVPARFLDLCSNTDLDFVLAHKVLEDPFYAEFFRTRPTSRELILDNSVHELGTPLKPEQLVRAAQLCRADFVVPPDSLEDAWWTVDQFEKTKEAFEQAQVEVKLAPVLVGDDSDSRRRLLEYFWEAPMLCLPYRRPRLEWWNELPSILPWKRIHLLGVSTLDEARAWAKIEATTRGGIFSIDTTKPIRWGIQGRRIDDGGSLRGGDLNAKDLLDVEKLSLEQRELIHFNLDFLKGVLDVRL